jgi:hypothetical protein
MRGNRRRSRIENAALNTAVRQKLHPSCNVKRSNRAPGGVKPVKIVEQTAVGHPFRDDAEWRCVRCTTQLQHGRMGRGRQTRHLALKTLKFRSVQLFDRNFPSRP